MKALNCPFVILSFLEASLFAQIQITRWDYIDAIRIAEAQARDGYQSSPKSGIKAIRTSVMITLPCQAPIFLDFRYRSIR